MIISGSGQGQATVGQLDPNTCPICGKRSTFSVLVNYTYAHLWWLFSFVKKREYLVRCDTCSGTAAMDQATVRQKFLSDNIPFIRRNGWIVGVILVAGLVALGFRHSAEQGRLMDERIASPVAGDVYLADLAKVEGSGFMPDENENIKKGEKAYGGLLLLDVDEDEDYVLATTNQAFDRLRNLKDAMDRTRNPLDYDKKNVLYLNREEVLDLRKKGIIVEVRRKK